MKIRILTATAAAATLVAGAASADCGAQMKQFSQRYDNLDRSMQMKVEPVLQNLRDAASVLNRQGLDQQCGDVVATMQKVLQSYQSSAKNGGGQSQDLSQKGSKSEPQDINAQDAVQEQMMTRGDMTEPDLSKTEIDAGKPGIKKGLDEDNSGVSASTDENGHDGQTASIRTEPANTASMGQDSKSLRDRLVPFGSEGGPVSTAEFVNSSVYNFNDETVGEVSGFLLNDKMQATHLILSHGGFWNIGDQRAVVPLDKVMWDPESNSLYVNASKDQIDNAPEFAMNDSAAWSSKDNDSYYRTLGTQ